MSVVRRGVDVLAVGTIEGTEYNCFVVEIYDMCGLLKRRIG